MHNCRRMRYTLQRRLIKVKFLATGKTAKCYRLSLMLVRLILSFVRMGIFLVMLCYLHAACCLYYSPFLEFRFQT
jgi:hypothetical protein